jgi:hypothetical protein
MIQYDHRHFFEPQLSCREQAPVPSDDARLRVHERLLKPNSAMLAAIGAICASECVRGFLAQGISLSITHSSIYFAIECRFNSFVILTAMFCKLDYRGDPIVCKILEAQILICC